MSRPRLDHVRVNVLDMETAERFYRELLELSVVVRYVNDLRHIVQMGAGGVPPGVELWCEPGVAPDPRENVHVAFAVDDVPALVHKATALGYAVHEAPFTIGEETVALLKDPDGHVVELNDFCRR